MIFDIDDTFCEADKWMFYEQNPKDEPEKGPKAYLDIYGVSSSVITVVFKGDDIQTFKNLLRRNLSLGKNYVHMKMTELDNKKSEG